METEETPKSTPAWRDSCVKAIIPAKVHYLVMIAMILLDFGKSGKMLSASLFVAQIFMAKTRHQGF